jgi:DNA-binding transcriptional MocR family regulator
MPITGTSAAEIFESVRLLVQAGKLSPGDVLPPVRGLAEQLEVNRNTVASAYRRLVTSGIAVALGRNGTVIRDQDHAGEQEGVSPGSPLRDLASGNPDPAWLPDPTAAWPAQRNAPRLYGQAVINPGLEAACRPSLAIDCPGDFEFNLTHGAVDAIERLLAAHLVSGDKVILEAPCFLSSLNTMHAAGFEVVPAGVDAEGMRVDTLEAALEQGARAVIVTPRAHNPTGYGISARRAKKLASLLARYPQVLVIVDDHYAALSSAPYHSVIPKNAQRWALVRSVSKVLGPDLRLAFVASDAHTSKRLRLRLAPGTNWVSHLLQDVVERTLFGPEARAFIAEARDAYARRRDLLVSALAVEGIAVPERQDGLNIWIPLKAGNQQIAAELAKRGWLVRGSDAFGVAPEGDGLRVTISTLQPNEATDFARDLAAILSSLS